MICSRVIAYSGPRKLFWGSHHILDVLSFPFVDKVNALPLVQNNPDFSDDDMGHGGRARLQLVLLLLLLIDVASSLSFSFTFNVLPGWHSNATIAVLLVDFLYGVM